MRERLVPLRLPEQPAEPWSPRDLKGQKAPLAATMRDPSSLLPGDTLPVSIISWMPGSSLTDQGSEVKSPCHHPPVKGIFCRPQQTRYLQGESWVLASLTCPHPAQIAWSSTLLTCLG